MDAQPLRRSPLDAQHRELGAHMTDFAGWAMPLDYGSVVAEHRAVRERCGLFDLSHLGTLFVSGAGAQDCVQAAFTNDVTALPVGRAQYSLCLDDAGGIVDDLLVYRLPRGFFIVPNAANTAAVWEALQVASAAGAVDLADVKGELATIAVQGPRAADMAAGADIDVAGLSYLDCRELSLGEPAAFGGVLARSGYTGEHGYELFVPADRAGGLWDRLLSSGAVPAGLGARDTLRLEMGYPLHGNDISPATSPVDARLSWAVKTDTDFRGRDAVLAAKQAGPRRRLWGLRATGRGIPRAHCSVERAGEPVGEVTSGTFSPTLRIGIAMAYLAPDVEAGELVDVDVRGKALPAEVVRPPFVDSDPRA